MYFLTYGVILPIYKYFTILMFFVLALNTLFSICHFYSNWTFILDVTLSWLMTISFQLFRRISQMQSPLITFLERLNILDASVLPEFLADFWNSLAELIAQLFFNYRIFFSKIHETKIANFFFKRRNLLWEKWKRHLFAFSYVFSLFL